VFICIIIFRPGYCQTPFTQLFGDKIERMAFSSKIKEPRTRPLGDSWTSPDKFEHFFGSATLSAGGLLALQVTHNDEAQSTVLVFSSVTCLGILKEVFDMYHPHHQASWKDLTADIVGTLLGLYVARVI